MLAAIASMQFAFAQSKNAESAKKAVESALKVSENPKKAGKAKTWIKLGNAYIDAYNAPMGNAWIGANKSELQLLMGGEKPVSSEEVVVNGQQLIKDSYSDKDFYFTPQGQLSIIIVTQPVYEDALSKAFQAFKKAYELDERKASDVEKGFTTINQKSTEKAYSAYSFGDMEKAKLAFKDAVQAAGEAPLSQLDTNSLYNLGFTAWATEDWTLARDSFDKCLAASYYGADGETFAKLADVATHQGDSTAVLNYLEDGFKKFPQSQSILIGLINYYISSGSNTDKLFVLLDEAKKNEPNNASLYYVEGNIRAKLGEFDEAIKAYKECATINPEYEFGYIGAGILYYNKAIEIQTAMQEELDDAKFNELNKEFETMLKACIDPFETAFNISKNDQVKASVAEYLKNACFRFSEDPKYLEAYKKYNSFIEGK